MSRFAGAEYYECKSWVAKKVEEGYAWEEIKHLCVSTDRVNDEFERLQYEEGIIPLNLDILEWNEFVDEIQSKYSLSVVGMYGVSSGEFGNSFTVPTSNSSPWVQYKNYLLGIGSGKSKMSNNDVDTIEINSHWILNHLKRDTRTAGAVKGLVMGSVQSGKTANMVGLVTMAAHYDWNFIIILSGTIDNLRKQTQNRFYNDLNTNTALMWHVLQHTSNKDYLCDLRNGDKCTLDHLRLNVYNGGRINDEWKHRYVTVCLKNATRLRNLIDWLHTNPQIAARLRILIIDDEADQASVNTRKMEAINEEEELDRTTVNKLIINLVNGKDSDGNSTSTKFQAVNYISYTATPYANVLNEAYSDSLYPKNFICTLPESQDYFGLRVIFGSKEDDQYDGLNIIRDIPKEEINSLKSIHDGNGFTIPKNLNKAVCWFLCSAAILRTRGHKKPISMLIHTTAIQGAHFELYKVLKEWFERELSTGSILESCKDIYEIEKKEFTLQDLKEGFPDYASIDDVNDEFPVFDDLRQDIEELINNIVNIKLDEDGQSEFVSNGIHLCVDNCSANKYSDEGTYLRAVYPNDEQLKNLEKAPVFIVMGGNTLSRGLTIEGLCCTYFARKSNQVDALMQMARWFGYRKGYELLQRIWMPSDIQKKFVLMAEIDEKLKNEFETFMDRGLSPAKVGPKIMSSSKIAKFILTSKNKSQNMEVAELDYSGQSYETTDFVDDSNKLLSNIRCVEEFLNKIGSPEKSTVSTSAYVWRDVSVTAVLSDFLSNNKYHIFEESSLHNEIPTFVHWMQEMNQDGKYLKWSVAIAGGGNAASTWNINNISVGKITRSKKRNKAEGYIDIGSLRSGIDVLCDVVPESLDADKKLILETAKKNKKNLIAVREILGLKDVPLLLIYCIDKNEGNETKTREKIKSTQDIIGFSIIVPGEINGASNVKSVRIKIDE